MGGGGGGQGYEVERNGLIFHHLTKRSCWVSEVRVWRVCVCVFPVSFHTTPV